MNELTPEEKVKAKWPDAHAYREFCYVQIFTSESSTRAISGIFTEDSEAWADAAKRIDEEGL